MVNVALNFIEPLKQCPYDPVIGRGGCMFGCSCRWYQSCFSLTAPIDLLTQLSNESMTNPPLIVTVPSGEKRVKIGACSLSVASMICISVFAYFFLIWLMMFLRFLLTRIEQIDEKKANSAS